METAGAKSKRMRRRGRLHQNFTSYISFGITSTLCACFFLLVYLLLLVGMLPLLMNSNVDNDHRDLAEAGAAAAEANVANGGNLRHLPISKQVEALGEKEHKVLMEVASNLKTKLENYRNSHHFNDQHLIDAAIKEFELFRNKKNKPAAAAAPVNKDPAPPAPGRRPGFFVLGMHRSGTSMLSGLLVHGSGYNVGGPLIGAHFDNQKGFFERIDAVLQNDEFMKSQKIWWASGVRGYDSAKAEKALKEKLIPFDEGSKALAFLNSADNIPWLQKDPRMCITLKTWLGLLKNEPAVLFTYRHPLEVALSLKHREKFPLDQGLRLWIIYNMRAVQNSQGLCRVLSSNDAVLASPLQEVKRIAQELTTHCGVPEAPKEITQEDVDKFIDPNMQHGKKEIGAGKGTLETYNGCDIPDYDSDYQPDTEDRKREQSFYIISMKMHCDFKNGKAYEDNYAWPEFP